MEQILQDFIKNNEAKDAYRTSKVTYISLEDVDTLLKRQKKQLTILNKAMISSDKLNLKLEEMDIKEIIKNLEHYNNWRRDNNNEYTMPKPKQIGITIDTAISELNKLLITDVVVPKSTLCGCGARLIKDVVGIDYCGNDLCKHK